MGNRRSETHFGLAIPAPAREKLRKAGIFVQTTVTVEHQQLARRYVLRGVESGGAVEEFGHYATFAGEDGSPLRWLCRVESLAVNGPHAVVVAPVLVRAEMLRVGNTCELFITRHHPGDGGNGKKRVLMSDLLFRGRHGHLGEGECELPRFFTRSGELLAVPERFTNVVASLVVGTRCVPCSHPHFLSDPDGAGPQGLANMKTGDAMDDGCGSALTGDSGLRSET
jgi:hypothetical protein